MKLPLSWPIKIVRISGHSMMPEINPGDLLLVNRWAYLRKKPQIGEIVVFTIDQQIFCKRIVAIAGEFCHVQGDNRSDSLQISPIKTSQIIGKVLVQG